MKRTALVACVLFFASTAALLAYHAVARNREYRRLIAVGDAALASDQTFVAIEAFSGAIALRPDAMVAHLKRGDTYRRRGDLRSALRDLRAAARLDPTATRPLEQLGDINALLGRHARAAEAYTAYLRLDDRSPRVLYKLALAWYREGRADIAIPPIRQALVFNDRSAEAHYLLGLCLRDRRRPDEARVAFERSIQLSPALAPPREELADLYRVLDRHREAIEQLETLAALDPGRPERHVAVGLAYAKTGRTDLAVATLGRAADRSPGQPLIYTALGRVWLDAAETRGDRVALNKAIEALQGIAADPTATSEILTLFGRALRLSGDAARAERVLQQATTRSPVEPDAFLHLAAVAERLRRIDLARDALSSYLALTPQHPDWAERAEQIGDLSMALDEPAVAAAWYRRAIAVSTPAPSLLARLADAQWRSGDRDAAGVPLRSRQ